MKKVIYIFFCIAALLFYCVPARGEANDYYTDMKDSFAGDAVKELAGQGIVKGVAPGKFGPEQYITREHFCVLAAKTLGVTPVYPDSPSFKDLSPRDPAYGYVEALARLGLISGNGTGCFKPGEPVKRQDAAVIAYRAAGDSAAGEAKISDSGMVSPYAAGAVDFVTLKGWMSAGNGYFYPLQGLTRGQAAVLAKYLYDERKWQAMTSLRDVAPRKKSAGKNQQLSLAPLPPEEILSYTPVYGLDAPDLASMEAYGKFTARGRAGNTLITVNAGDSWYNVEMAIADASVQTGGDALSATGGTKGETELEYTYRVEQASPDSTFQNMEQKQYSGPVDGLQSSGEIWTGFLRQQGRDITADLGRVTSVSQISLEFKQDVNAGIKMPEYLKCAVSVDGEKWYYLGRVNHGVSPADSSVQTRALQLTFPPVNAKYVKISFPVDVYVFARHLSIRGGLPADKPAVLSSGNWAGIAELNYLLIPDMKDILLIYSGTVANGSPVTWNTGDFLPLAGYLDTGGAVRGRMFDTMLFLPFPGTTGNRDNWSAYLDSLFAPGQQLQALDQAVASVNNALGDSAREKVILTLPYPDPQQHQFGTLDKGEGPLSFSVEDVDGEKALANRLQALQWYYAALKEKWRGADFKNLELAGIYWYKENIDNRIPGERELVVNTAKMVRDDGQRFFWIPYFGAYGYQNWRSYGFSHVILQPNFYTADDIVEDRMSHAAEHAGRYNLGVELEIDDRITYSRNNFDLFYRELDWADRLGLDGSVTNAYYAGSKTLLNVRNSDVPQIRAIYDDLYRWINGTYQPKGN
ncbi:hypothetical protein DCCM_2063 [Desulfocucumis palustris]|uniref:Uncharacterized protein n=1 Tax=Desulfocucumis palustris TaxID=1898651 RepID=A0A2L2XFF2_9FIRM|nr:DUF4855 domain-containing protein [Desulfocucumis palustris]GBF32966.1 hypothetical protein DCCM_2063 [Desulfocucumis palustris]